MRLLLFWGKQSIYSLNAKNLHPGQEDQQFTILFDKNYTLDFEILYRKTRSVNEDSYLIGTAPILSETYHFTSTQIRDLEKRQEFINAIRKDGLVYENDGTFNLIALMAAVYQSDVPQYLCIEEPENGLHPQAIQLLVDIFREQCEEHGHHILLNTHSQTLVRCLHAEEIILVNKVQW